MKKKVLAFLLIAVLLLGLAACGEDTPADPNLIVVGDYQARYTGAEVVKDFDGNDSIAIHFDYTNNSKEAESFAWSIGYEIMQDGTDLEFSTVFISEDSYDSLSDSYMEDAEPGETIEVILTHKLEDEEKPVDLTFYNMEGKKYAELSIDMATVTWNNETVNGGEEPTEAEQDDPNQVKIGDYELQYKGSEVVKDDYGNDAVIATFDYTNNGKEPEAFMWAVYFTAVQNGVELESAYVYVSEDSYEAVSDSQYDDVAPGETLEIRMPYVLSDLTNNVELTFTDLFETEKDVVVINLSEAAWNNEAAEPEQPETPETPVENSDRIVIEEFEITFAGAELTLDDEGNEAILIGLNFTNNGSETVSFQSDLMYEVYQGETELDDCTVYTGEDSSTTYDDSMYVDVAPGETHLVCMTYALSDLTTPVVLELSNIMEDETGTVTIDLSEASLETSEEGEFSPEFAALYAGDWHGMAEFAQCSGKFEKMNGQQVEIIARFVFDDNGNCTPYIRLCLSQDESENLQNLSVAYDAEYDCMFLYGDLYNLEIGGDYTFVMLNENRALNICVDNIEDPDNALYVRGCLRRLDESWDYELDYPYLPEDGVAFYSGMSMEEIVELYGYDTALLPQAEGGSGAETPAAPPETPAEVGIVDLQVLIDFKNWLDEVNTYENDYYKPTFEECLEKMGCEGTKVREDEWTDTQQSYRWKTADGRDNISMVIRLDDEGVWRWHSISWTGGVNG